ncbi:WD repeat-containing protein 44 [Trichinella murrelli]|uniref:WD repeat-containing protein 44 n=1 Tax=Trichinella murrelli TaxID=144512 RepID=A0A0V0TTL6_9BILA|nr:WD repeat-containing protein 44 [Trichinella murrelli]
MPSCVSRFAGAMSSCSPIEPANQNIVRNILYKHRTVVISVVKIMPPKRAVAAKRATVSKNEAVNDKKKAVQRKKKVYSLAPVLPDAEILTDAKKQKWLLGKHFASGGFGRIHFVEKVDDKCKAVAKIEFATNGPLYTEMHYYQRAAGLDKLSEWKKQHGLDFLGLPPLLGFGTHCNAGNDYRFLVIPQFGPNLEYVRMKLGGKFSISSVTRLAVNCLNIYEYLHNQGYAYADLKGDNMVLEQLEPVDYKKEVKIWQSYLIDFGLVYRVTLGAALKLDPKKAHQGTREYTSLDAHYGATPSFRSDLEILGYNILFWLNGDLPWLSSTSDIDVMKKKENFKENLEKESLKFMETGQLSICVPILKKFFAYTYDLDYGSLPDYTFLRNLFKTVEITTEADNNSSTKKLRSSSNKSTMSPAQHPGPSKAMRTCRATELKRKCASSSKTNANKSKQKQVRDSENQQSENRRSDRFAHLGIIPGMANFRTKSLAQSLIRRKSVAQSVVDKYVTISRSNAVPRRRHDDDDDDQYFDAQDDENISNSPTSRITDAVDPGVQKDVMLTISNFAFPDAEEIERDFAELRLSLLNSARELYVHEERNSLGLTWGQKLLLQADNGSASTSVAQDTLSTKGSSENRASSQVTLKRSRSSQSSHDNDLHQLQNSVSRLCSSAGNSRNSTLEKFLPAELSALEAALEDDNHFVDHATSSTPKTRSLTRDVDVSVLKNCKSVFPMEELMKLQRKYSSAEMVIDALTNEYKLSGGFSVSGSEVDSFSNVDTPPVRPPRRRKNLQHQLLMNKLKISTEVEETPPKQITTVKSPETFLKPLPVFDEDKMGQRNVAKLDHIKRISSGCCNPGVNPLSLHMLRKSKGNLSVSIGESDSESLASSDSTNFHLSRSLNRLSVKTLRKGINFGHAVNKKIRAVYRWANTEKIEKLDESGQSDNEEMNDGNGVIQVRASHHHKGPFYFDQLKLVQDLSGQHLGAVWCMRFSRCGRLLATAGQDNVIRIWVLKCAFDYFKDMRTRFCADKIIFDESFRSAESDDGELSRLVRPTTTEENFPRPPPSLHLTNALDDDWAPFTPQPIACFSGHNADVLDLSWSKSYFLLSSSMDRTVRLWHVSRSECLCRFQHSDFVTSIAFSPKDDRYFVSGSLDGKIRLWLIPEKKVCFWNELDEGQMVTAVTYVRKGDLVVVGTYDGRCLIYTADKLSYHAQIDIRKSTLKGCHGSKITGLDSYRDKLLITCNDSRIRLYDLRDLSLCCKYRGFMNKSSQIRAQFNHNGQFVISGSEDSMVYLWKTHVELGTLPLPIRKDRSCRWERIKAHRAVVTAASFAPNPRLIFDQIDRTRNKTPEEPLPDKSPSPPLTIDTQSVPEVIVSADFVGCVYVYINKPRLCRYNSLMISVFYRPFRPSNLSIVRTWCNRVDLTEQQTIATAVDDAQNNFDLAQRPFGYGVDATSVRLNWWESNQRFTFWAKWAMRRDWRRRQVIAEYNDVRIRMKAILRNDFLPTAIRQEMKQEMQKLPRCCFPRYVRNICQITGRKRGNPKEWLNSGDLFQRAEAMVVFDIVAPDHLKPNLQSLKTYRLNEDSTPEFSTLWLEIQKTFSENDPTLIESSMNGVNSGNDIPIASTYDDTPALFAQGSSDELPLDKETKATLAIKSWLEENKTVRNGVPDLYLFNFESLLWIVEQQHTATNSQEVRDAIAKIETLITKELQNSYTRYSFYSQDYAVTFNIIFWLMFSFIITIMFIGVGMWTMSPGRDSLIYQ